MKQLIFFISSILLICYSCKKETEDKEAEKQILAPEIHFTENSSIDSVIKFEDSIKIEFYITSSTKKSYISYYTDFSNQIEFFNVPDDSVLSFYVKGIGLFKPRFTILAIDKNGLSTGESSIFTILYNHSYESIQDIDGNTYKTIQIENKTWMAENLRVTKYNDNTAIDHIVNTSDWNSHTQGAYCTPNNTTNTDSIQRYGNLYNNYVVQTNKICPAGWHVPSASEWSELKIKGMNSEVPFLHERYENRNFQLNYENFIFNALGFSAEYSYMRRGDSNDFINQIISYWTSDIDRYCIDFDFFQKINAPYNNIGIPIRCIKD